MTPDIHELDAETRDRIAAGEVVERPASVVKELLENALDADASRIDVSVEAGGKDRIQVSDDGHGMSEPDARMAVREHTTSKLSDIDELGSIGTLGFRGEALHAIGSVARLVVRTKPQGGDRGTEVVVEDGELVASEPVGCPEGTSVEVTDLFRTVPARREYLKTNATEFDRIQRIVTGYALANPDVAIALEHDGRRTFATPGDGDRRSAVLSVYGREVAESMIDVRDGEGDGPISGLSGLVSHPETNRAGRAYMTTLVNGRYVTANVVREAIVAAYGSQLAPDRYPFAVVDVELPDGGVDVNVHPRKLEVLFADEEGLKAQVRSAIEQTLLEEGGLRSRAPRGRSAADQTDVGHETEGASTDPDSKPVYPESKTVEQDSRTNDPDPKTVEQRRCHRGEGDGTGTDEKSTTGAGEGPTATAESESTEPVESKLGFSDKGETVEGRKIERRGNASPDSGIEPEAAETPSISTPSDTASQSWPSHSSESKSTSPTTDPAVETPKPGVKNTQTETPARTGRVGDPGTRRFRDTPTQRTLAGDVASGTPDDFDRLPPMRVLGQFDDTYLVAQTDDGLVLIDQHAADERINYERLRERFSGDVTTQTLAEPVEVSLTAREAELATAAGDALSQLGFRVHESDRTLVVTTVPALLAEEIGDGVAQLARDLLDDVLETDVSGTVDSVADDVIGDLACHPSVTANTSLTEGRVSALLSSLDECENPYACPHGRPTIIHLSREEIDDRFERDYPGHAHRREF